MNLPKPGRRASPPAKPKPVSQVGKAGQGNFYFDSKLGSRCRFTNNPFIELTPGVEYILPVKCTLVGLSSESSMIGAWF
jgi:hypothetical protein